MMIRLPFILLFLLSIAAVSSGDTLLLRTGGNIEGQVTVVRDDAKTISHYVVKLASGGHMKLDARQVKRHVKPTAQEQDYRNLLQNMPDTAEGHWKMSQFCAKNRLPDQKSYHIERVIQLDPNHEEARKALGYTLIDGKWTRQDEWMARRGFVRYKGGWRTAQDIAITERKREIELRQKSLRTDMKRWRGWIGGRRDSEARENFASIDDPLAAMGLIDLFEKEKLPEIRELYIDTMARLPGRGITVQLLKTAMSDEDNEVQDRAIEHLLTRNADSFITHSLIPYLTDKKNSIVNQAGYILGRIGHRDAIKPLIDSLVTTHVRYIHPQGNIRPTFSSNGTGLSTGTKPKKITETKRNASVLKALAKITGKNFQYSEEEWKRWLMQSRSPQSVSLRRDP